MTPGSTTLNAFPGHAGRSYGDSDIRWWADRIAEWTGSGLDVFAYFNNDGGGNAVRNALALRELVTVVSRTA